MGFYGVLKVLGLYNPPKPRNVRKPIGKLSDGLALCTGRPTKEITGYYPLKNPPTFQELEKFGSVKTDSIALILNYEKKEMGFELGVKGMSFPNVPREVLIHNAPQAPSQDKLFFLPTSDDVHNLDQVAVCSEYGIAVYEFHGQLQLPLTPPVLREIKFAVTLFVFPFRAKENYRLDDYPIKLEKIISHPQSIIIDAAERAGLWEETYPESFAIRGVPTMRLPPEVKATWINKHYPIYDSSAYFLTWEDANTVFNEVNHDVFAFFDPNVSWRTRFGLDFLF